MRSRRRLRVPYAATRGRRALLGRSIRASAPQLPSLACAALRSASGLGRSPLTAARATSSLRPALRTRRPFLSQQRGQGTKGNAASSSAGFRDTRINPGPGAGALQDRSPSERSKGRAPHARSAMRGSARPFRSPPGYSSQRASPFSGASPRWVSSPPRPRCCHVAPPLASSRCRCRRRLRLACPVARVRRRASGCAAPHHWHRGRRLRAGHRPGGASPRPGFAPVGVSRAVGAVRSSRSALHRMCASGRGGGFAARRLALALVSFGGVSGGSGSITVAVGVLPRPRLRHVGLGSARAGAGAARAAVHAGGRGVPGGVGVHSVGVGLGRRLALRGGQCLRIAVRVIQVTVLELFMWKTCLQVKTCDKRKNGILECGSVPITNSVCTMSALVPRASGRVIPGPRGGAVLLSRRPVGWVLSLRPLGIPRGWVLRQSSETAALAVARRFARRFC